MDNVDGITSILIIVLGGMIAILVILVLVYLMLTIKNRKKQKEQKISLEQNNTQEQKTVRTKSYKEYTKESIFNFLEFKKIEDNMIIQDKNKYLMVLECQGINFDLMSEMEKVSVEQGFIQFLNTLRFPIQLYIQTRTVNLQNSINGYKDKLTQIESKYRSMQLEYNDMVKSGAYPEQEIRKYYYELTKQRNLYEYTLDIIRDTERISLNHNVLNKKYYVVVSHSDLELDGHHYTEDEIQNMAFSELYTKCQSIIRTLISSEIKARILTSEELAELLYNAYNREDADALTIENAFRSGYEDLYSTAPDVLDKKMAALNRVIQQKANELAQQKVDEVRSEKERKIFEKEENIDDLITELAQDLIQQNERYIGVDIANEAIEKIQEDKENPKGGNENEQEKEKITTRRGRPRKA